MVRTADLRAVWNMTHETSAKLGAQILLDRRMFEQVCSPGADVEAVWYRTSMLWMLSTVLPKFEVTDAAFEIAATFPMKKMKVGVVYNEPTFDLQEFMKQVAGAGKT